MVALAGAALATALLLLPRTGLYFALSEGPTAVPTPFNEGSPVQAPAEESPAARRAVRHDGDSNSVRLMVIGAGGERIDDAQLVARWEATPVAIPGNGLSIPLDKIGKPFVVSAPGYAPLSDMLLDNEFEHLARLQRGRSVTVSVVDTDGQPVPGVKVSVSTESVPPLRTDDAFFELAPRPSPHRVEQAGMTGDSGDAVITGLPYSDVLYCDVASRGWMRISERSHFDPNEDRLSVVVARLFYAAARVRRNDIASWRMRTAPSRAPMSVRARLSRLSARIRNSLPEGSALWLSVAANDLPREVAFEFYSRVAGTMSTQVPVRPFLGNSNIRVDEFDGSDTPAPGYGILRIDALDSTGASVDLRRDDLVLQPPKGQSGIWTMGFATGRPYVLPPGEYTLAGGNALLTQALPALPVRFTVAAGSEERFVLRVDANMYTVSLEPITDTGARLTSWMFTASAGDKWYGGAAIGDSQAQFRVPQGKIRLKITHPIGGVFEGEYDITGDTVITIQLQR